MRDYTPRKCSRRWLDGDCPSGILAIFDNKGATCDRYTVVYSEPLSGTTPADMWLGYRAMSENPSSPLGVGLWGEFTAYAAAQYRYHYKHQYAKWTSLPQSVQECVKRDLEGLKP